ncbi:hypothetical protein SLEP1_g30589 [Rubroshorea leprosula]|uniref:Uncharacterized protein n=1 Tax=Rubroshorea leprosula TaxID=152421 RepID=A0AAV5K732_9ROSI|nr:hypothetical protein SLEP1_g30589 [Rubroshorea leprosula]
MANYYQSSPFPPPRLCFFLLIIVFLLGFSWCVNYEPVVESVVGRVKLIFRVSPLILLLVVHRLSNNQSIISLSSWGVGKRLSP